MKNRLSFAMAALPLAGMAHALVGRRAATGTSAATPTISLAATIPSGSSPPIDPAFASFAFEEAAFLQYAGPSGDSNTFSQNLVNVIASKTRIAPIMRVGGTSADHAIFEPDQTQQLVIPPSQQGKGIPIGIMIGPSYFDSFAHFNESQYFFDIPLYTDNLTNSVQLAQSAKKGIPAAQLFGFEIGNEPNNYKRYKGSNGPDEYVQQWLEFAKNITSTLGFSSSDQIYEAFTRSTPDTDAVEGPWTVQNNFADGLNSYASNIKTVSIHYYQCHSNDSLQSCLMDHAKNVGRAGYFSQPAAYLAQNYPDIPLVLGELGNTLGHSTSNPTGEGFQDSLGAALWAIDFSFLAMINGVRRINFQNGLGFTYALWQPTELNNTPPAVRAPFYGPLFVADFIGPNVEAQTPTGSYRTSPSGDTLRIVENTVSIENFSAYTAYENGDLSRMALINFDFWDSSTDSGSRPVQEIVLRVPSNIKTATTTLLTSPSGALSYEEGSITYGGEYYSYADNGLGTQKLNDTKTYNISGGMVTIPVAASSAVRVDLQ